MQEKIRLLPLYFFKMSKCLSDIEIIGILNIAKLNLRRCDMYLIVEYVEKKMTEVVAALIWDKNKFMICQRPAHKARGLLWEFVGGKVEPGETKEQALIRECREELAVTLDVGKVFMDVVHEYPDLTVHLTLFHATIQEGIPQKLEHNDIRWITVDEIDQYAFCPADEGILMRLKQSKGRKD